MWREIYIEIHNEGTKILFRALGKMIPNNKRSLLGESGQKLKEQTEWKWMEERGFQAEGCVKDKSEGSKSNFMWEEIE